MPRKKNLLDYVILALFAMCMGLALCACMFYVTRATDREYLNQGKWVLSMMALSLLALLGARMSRKAGSKMPERAKTVVMLVICALLTAAGVGLRLWVIRSIPIEPDSDFETYYRMAGELLRDTLMSPDAAADRRYIALYPHTIGFPMFLLWPTFAVFGESVLHALYANLVCSCIGILLMGHIARRLSGRVGAVVAVGLISLWPSHIFYSTMVATEPSFTMLILLAADIMLSLLDREKGSLYELNPGRSIGMMMLLGVVLALAGAIRPMAVILLAAYCVAQLFVTGDPTNRVKLDGVRFATSQPIVCILLVLLCYLVTNFVISRAISDMIGEQPASGLSASGYNLMLGLNSESGGLWNETDSDFFAEAYESTGSANAAHQACLEVAVQRFQNEPENVLNLMVSKFCDLWGTDDFGIDWVLLWTGQQNTLTPELQSLLEDIRPIGRVLYMSVLLFAAFGCMEAWRRRYAPPVMVLVCMLFFLGTALSHMLLETQVRYHYNMIPFLILLASWTINNWGTFPQEKETLRLVYQEQTVESGPEKDHTRFDMAKALADGHIFVSTTQNVAKQAEADAKEKIASEAPVETTTQEAVAETVEEPDVETLAQEVVETDTVEAVETPAEETADEPEHHEPEETEEVENAPAIVTEPVEKATEEAIVPETATIKLTVYEKSGGVNRSIQCFKNKSISLTEGEWMTAKDDGKKSKVTAKIKFLGQNGKKSTRISIILYEKTCENKNTMLYYRKGCCVNDDEWSVYSNVGEKRKITVCMKMQ